MVYTVCQKYSHAFDAITNRKNTYSSKWDFFQKYLTYEGVIPPDDTIPMWVADMDFITAPPIVTALETVAQRGIYGYSEPSQSVTDAILAWMEMHYDIRVSSSQFLYTSASMTGLYFVLQTLTNKHDTILLCQPTYPPIFEIVQNTQKNMRIHMLRKNSDATSYEIDFEVLERDLKNVKMFIMCNPHNPTGTAWKYEDLVKIIELCKKHDVLICSDDVHADIIYAPNTYTSIHSVAEKIAPDFLKNIITLFSPNKTFNTGGIKVAMLIIPDSAKKQCIAQAQRPCLGTLTVSPFGIAVLEAAYTLCAEWKNALVQYLQKNNNTVYEYITTHISDVSIVKPQATYLAWLDFSHYMATRNINYTELHRILLQEAKIGMGRGTIFGNGGENHMRLNFACPHSVLQDALQQLSQAL